MYHKDQWIAQHERAVEGFACGDLTYAQAMVELLDLGFMDDEAHAELFKENQGSVYRRKAKHEEKTYE